MTGHAGHHLMDATAKYYKVDLTGKVNNCLSCSLEKIRQKISQRRMKTRVRILQGSQQGHKMQHNDGTRLSSGFLVSFASGVLERNC